MRADFDRRGSSSTHFPVLARAADHDELVYSIRMTMGELLRDVSAERVSDDACTIDSERVEHDLHVVDHSVESGAVAFLENRQPLTA